MKDPYLHPFFTGEGLDFVDRSEKAVLSVMKAEDKKERFVDPSRYYSVDQYAAKDFNVNDHGTINNDLTALLHPKDFSDLQARLMNYVEQIQAPFNDKSDAEVLRYLVPHGAQTPAEYSSAVSQISALRASVEAQRKAREQEAADLTKQAQEASKASEKATAKAAKKIAENLDDM